MSRLVFADTETTGIRPDMGAEIWELAIIVRDEPGSAGSDDEYVWHFRPNLSRADPFALKVGGYYDRCTAAGYGVGDARVVTSPEFEKGHAYGSLAADGIALRIAELLNGAHLLAANPAFDAGHLDALLRKYGECLSLDYHYTDIGSLVRGWALGSFAGAEVPFPLKLDAAAKLARVDPDAYDRHSALGDVRLIRDVYDAVTGDAA